MGNQGTLRDAKARRYYNALPERLRSQYSYVGAFCWRSNHHVWLHVHNAKGEDKVIRMNRDTLEIEPLGFGNEVS